MKRHGDRLLEVEGSRSMVVIGGHEADVEAERDGWGNTEYDVKQLELEDWTTSSI